MTEFSKEEIETIISEYLNKSDYSLYNVGYFIDYSDDIIEDERKEKCVRTMFNNMSGHKRAELPNFLYAHLPTLMEISSKDADETWIAKSPHDITTYIKLVHNTIQLLEKHLKDRAKDKTYKEQVNADRKNMSNVNRSMEEKIEAFKSHALGLLHSMGHPLYTKKKNSQIVDLGIAFATSGRPKEQLDAINSLYHMIDNAEEYIQHTHRKDRKVSYDLSSIKSLRVELAKLPIPNKVERINTFIIAVKKYLH